MPVSLAASLAAHAEYHPKLGKAAITMIRVQLTKSSLILLIALIDCKSVLADSDRLMDVTRLRGIPAYPQFHDRSSVWLNHWERPTVDEIQKFSKVDESNYIDAIQFSRRCAEFRMFLPATVILEQVVPISEKRTKRYPALTLEHAENLANYRVLLALTFVDFYFPPMRSMHREQWHYNPPKIPDNFVYLSYRVPGSSEPEKEEVARIVFMRAINDYERVLAISKALPDSCGVQIAQLELAALHYQTGDLESGRKYFNEARLTECNCASGSRVISNLCRFWPELGSHAVLTYSPDTALILLRRKRNSDDLLDGRNQEDRLATKSLSTLGKNRSMAILLLAQGLELKEEAAALEERMLASYEGAETLFRYYTDNKMTVDVGRLFESWVKKRHRSLPIDILVNIVATAPTEHRAPICRFLKSEKLVENDRVKSALKQRGWVD